jgi:hypothetical protein
MNVTIYDATARRSNTYRVSYAAGMISLRSHGYNISWKCENEEFGREIVAAFLKRQQRRDYVRHAKVES